MTPMSTAIDYHSFNSADMFLRLDHVASFIVNANYAPCERLPWMASAEQSGLLMRIAATGNGSLCVPMKSSVRFWNCKGGFMNSR